MQKSEELKEVIQVVNEQFVHLHINVQHAGFLMDYKESEDMHIWLADPHKVPSELTIPYFDSPHWNSFREAKEKGLDFFANQLDYEEKNRFYNDLLKLFPVPDDAREYYLTCPGLAISTVLLDNIGLYIENFSGIPYTGEENAILMRFGKVFEQAYIRFNDLKQAEIQAREAHIEAALERIRSRSMALQKSSELEEVIRVVFNEWKRLGLELYECNINIIDEDTKAMTIWSYGWGETSTIKGTRLQFFDHPFLVQLVKDFRKQTKYGTYEMAGEESREYLRRVFTETDFKYIADEYKQALLSVDHVFINNAFMKYGSLDVISSEALPNDKSEILIRFAKVFEQAYTRFLDLQKAEAQARDAQIEAALERIRAKVMAMNNTRDLDDTSQVFGEQLRKLGIDWQFSYFWLLEEAKNENTFWITWPDYKTSTTIYTIAEAEEYFKECIIEWRKGTRIHESIVPKSEVQPWLDTFSRITEDADGEAKEVMQSKNFPDGVYYYDAMMKYGSFGITVNKPATEEEKNIQVRFAVEFERAYTRFLDLKKAEAQAREATIEAALEKVRGKAIAMHDSNDVTATASEVFTELKKLGIRPMRCGVGLLDKDSRKAMIYSATGSGVEDNLSLVGWVMLEDHEILSSIYDSWARNEDYFPVMEGNLLKTYNEKIQSGFLVPDAQLDYKQYGYFMAFSVGSFYGWSEKPFTGRRNKDSVSFQINH